MLNRKEGEYTVMKLLLFLSMGLEFPHETPEQPKTSVPQQMDTVDFFGEQVVQLQKEEQETQQFLDGMDQKMQQKVQDRMRNQEAILKGNGEFLKRGLEDKERQILAAVGVDLHIEGDRLIVRSPDNTNPFCMPGGTQCGDAITYSPQEKLRVTVTNDTNGERQLTISSSDRSVYTLPILLNAKDLLAVTSRRIQAMPTFQGLKKGNVELRLGEKLPNQKTPLKMLVGMPGKQTELQFLVRQESDSLVTRIYLEAAFRVTPEQEQKTINLLNAAGIRHQVDKGEISMEYVTPDQLARLVVQLNTPQR